VGEVVITMGVKVGVELKGVGCMVGVETGVKVGVELKGVGWLVEVG